MTSAKILCKLQRARVHQGRKDASQGGIIGAAAESRGFAAEHRRLC